MGKKSEQNIGYWVSRGAFEGGVVVPDNYDKPGILFKQIKDIYKKLNPSGISNVEEFILRCNMNYDHVSDEEIKNKLEKKCWWTIQEFEEKMDKMGMRKKKIQASTDTASKKSQGDKGVATLGANATIQVESSTTQNKSQQSEESTREQDFVPASGDAVIDCLEKYKFDLEKEIEKLESVKKENKRKIDEATEVGFNYGSDEIGLKSKVKKNGEKIKANVQKIQEREKEMWKKGIEDIVKMSEEKMEDVERAVKECKKKVENESVNIANQRKKLQRRRTSQIEILGKIMESNANITFFSPGKLFENQPDKVKEEIRLVGNMKNVSTRKGEWNEVLKEIDCHKAGTNLEEEVGVLVVKVNKEEARSVDKSLLDLNVNSFVASIDIVQRKMETKFSKVFVVLPPASEETLDYIAKVAEKIEKGTSKVIMLNVVEAQQKIGEKMEKNELVWRKGEIAFRKLEETKSEAGVMEMNPLAVRLVLSEVANKVSGSTANKKWGGCLDCGLIHKLNHCPTELLVKKKEEKKNEDTSKKDRVDEKDRAIKRFRYTEECLKCLQDHKTKDCWVRPTFRCVGCGGSGHHPKVHQARNPDVKKVVKELYE